MPCGGRGTAHCDFWHHVPRSLRAVDYAGSSPVTGRVQPGADLRNPYATPGQFGLIRTQFAVEPPACRSRTDADNGIHGPSVGLGRSSGIGGEGCPKSPRYVQNKRSTLPRRARPYVIMFHIFVQRQDRTFPRLRQLRPLWQACAQQLLTCRGSAAPDPASLRNSRAATPRTPWRGG